MKTKKLSAAYNPEVDFWKFFFAVIIFVFHSGGIINGGNPIKLGYLGVEFFFIVSASVPFYRCFAGIDPFFQFPVYTNIVMDPYFEVPVFLCIYAKNIVFI